MKMNTTEYFFSPYWHVNLSETIDWMEADLNESLQFIVRKGRVKKSMIGEDLHTSPPQDRVMIF